MRATHQCVLLNFSKVPSFEDILNIFSTGSWCREEVISNNTTEKCPKRTMTILMPSICERKDQSGLLIILLKGPTTATRTRPVCLLLSIPGLIFLVMREGGGAVSPVTQARVAAGHFHSTAVADSTHLCLYILHSSLHWDHSGEL